MKETAIGVHVHAHPQRLLETLAALRAHTAPRFALLLLPDGPNPQTRAVLAQLSDIPQSATEAPLGSAACFNRLALHNRNAEILVLLESGTIVGPDWLDRLCDALAADPRHGLASPSTNRGWNQLAAFRSASGSPEDIARTAAEAEQRFGRSYCSLAPLWDVGDFCLAARRAAIEAAGPADEAYGLGLCWAKDYAARVARAGFLAVWAQGAYVFRHPPTPRRQRAEARLLDAERPSYPDRSCGERPAGVCSAYAAHHRPAEQAVRRLPIQRPREKPMEAFHQRDNGAQIARAQSGLNMRGRLASNTLPAFAGRHRDASILVCGCGPSLNQLTGKPDSISIGVNDVGRKFDPDYLVVVNPPSQFPPDRLRAIAASRARAVFSQYSNLLLSHAPLVHFRLGKYNGTDFTNPEVLHYTQNSPYVALCLAIHMGARRIGLIGVDFTDNHFFGATGRHSLAGRLAQIEREYAALKAACVQRNIEVFNLGETSRLAAFPRRPLDQFLSEAAAAQPLSKNERPDADAPQVGVAAPCPDPFQPLTSEVPTAKPIRIFFVHYRFLACGEVFTDGLRHAAEALRIAAAHAYWEEPGLPAQVKGFAPDLLFVVDGRRFVQRWGDAFRTYNSAVWLVNEPYEVDDTSRWSSRFRTVFINDPSTLHRHRNAHYLPVGYSPEIHHSGGGEERSHDVGFVGAHNATRERLLLQLLEAGLLTYVVGGPWTSPRLRRICLADNIPYHETATLYRQTKIVVNVFRERHHFNRHGISARSLNPRVYEGLACGALVVSERRPELTTEFPVLPTFETGEELVTLVRRLLRNDQERRRLLQACRQSIDSHSYAERLKTVLSVTSGEIRSGGRSGIQEHEQSTDAKLFVQPESAAAADSGTQLPANWVDYGSVATAVAQNEVAITKPRDHTAGSERGLASQDAFGDVELAFDVQLADDTIFLAKVHQTDRSDQLTNSYHLRCAPARDYLAMHHRVLRDVAVPRNRWVSLALSWRSGQLRLSCNGAPVAMVEESALPTGYCFVGVKAGRARVRNLSLGRQSCAPLGQDFARPSAEVTLPTGWVAHGQLLKSRANGCILLLADQKVPGSEVGITSDAAFTQVELSFELKLATDTAFIAKLHQQNFGDLASNSYHLVCSMQRDYFAKHNKVFQQLRILRDEWISISLRCVEHGRVEVWINGVSVVNAVDNQLQAGFCFLGVVHGSAELRNIRLHDLSKRSIRDATFLTGNHANGATKIAPLPFSRMPRRNLIFHIWPVKGSMWRWNIEQLKQRIDIFNGRRLIGVVHDARSDAPEAVMDALEGHGCEFIVRPNEPSGEPVTFPNLLREVASVDPDEITFYAHAKGVKYEPKIPAPVRRWTEVLYRTALDNWLEVKEQLQRFALTGPLRISGRFRTHRNLGDWHYCGTFFWMRHAYVFGRGKSLEIPQFYGGVEAWPGLHFRKAEAGCLFMDELRQLPYHAEFWASQGESELLRWEAQRRGVARPASLGLNPLDEEGSPRAEQKPEELVWFLEMLLKTGLRRLLTIGAKHGGLEWHVARCFRQHGRDIEITTIDLAPTHRARKAFSEAASSFGQKMSLINGDSSSATTRAQLHEKYDAVFIDGNHSYYGVRSDWLLAKSLRPRIIGFHDIVDSDWHVQCRCCVSRLWAEISAEHTTQERESGVWGGIGIVT